MQCRCTRNTSCSKPAGHPGFCSGPRAAAAETAWHSRQGSPRAGPRPRSDDSPQRASRLSHRRLDTPSSKANAESPKEVPSKNPPSCKEPAAPNLDHKAEAQSRHSHHPQAHPKEEDREGGSAQPMADQLEPPNAPPLQAGPAQEGRPFVSRAWPVPITLSRRLPSAMRPASMHKCLHWPRSFCRPLSLLHPLQACPCCIRCRRL